MACKKYSRENNSYQHSFRLRALHFNAYKDAVDFLFSLILMDMKCLSKTTCPNLYRQIFEILIVQYLFFSKTRSKGNHGQISTFLPHMFLSFTGFCFPFHNFNIHCLLTFCGVMFINEWNWPLTIKLIVFHTDLVFG